MVIYSQNSMAFLTARQHQERVLTLSEPARQKILIKTRRLGRSLAHQLDHAPPHHEALAFCQRNPSSPDQSPSTFHPGTVGIADDVKKS